MRPRSLKYWFPAALVGVLCATVTPARADRDVRLNELADDFYDRAQKRQLRPKLSESGNRGWVRQLDRLGALVDEIDPAELSDDGRVTHAMLKRAIDIERRHVADGWVELDLGALDSPLVAVAQAIDAVPRRTVSDWNWVIATVAAREQFVDNYIALLRRGLKNGRVRSRAVAEGALRQARLLASKDPSRNPLAALEGELSEALAGHPELPALRRRLRKALGEALPAHARMARFLKGEYLPNAPRSTRLPGELYRHQLEHHLGQSVDSAELLRWGKKEVSRLRREIEVVARRQNPRLKNLSAFVNGIGRRNSEQFADGAELLAAAEAEVKTARRWARGRVPVPRSRVTVAPVGAIDAETEDAQYVATSDSTGEFQVNDGTRLGSLARHELPSLATHETFPGHHVQTVYAAQNARTWFRGDASLTAYDEGWAMYADHLRYESGGYDDLGKIGHLRFKLWAAAQLVTDISLHTGKMTPAQARKYMARHMFSSPAAVAGEVERMLDMPGHAVSYSFGLREFLRLRRQVKRQLGKRFNEKAFHKALLKRGAMPLELLRTSMKQWGKRSLAARKRPRAAKTLRTARRPKRPRRPRVSRRGRR